MDISIYHVAVTHVASVFLAILELEKGAKVSFDQAVFALENHWWHLLQSGDRAGVASALLCTKDPHCELICRPSPRATHDQGSAGHRDLTFLLHVLYLGVVRNFKS